MPHTLLFRNFSPEHFQNRELGHLAFNQRVLAQAQDERIPLLERLRFLCIVSSNLDEFFEIRVAGLKEHIHAQTPGITIDGLTARESLARISVAAHELVATQYDFFNEVLLPALDNEGIHFWRRAKWTEAQREWIQAYFWREVAPVLTPIGLDPAHPFPRVLNKSLNFAVELEGKDAFGRNSGAAILQAPRALPRVIRLPDGIAGAPYGFVFLSSILHEYVNELFTGMTVLGCYQFRVTRNSDLWVDEEEVTNLRITLQGELSQRHFGDAVRLEVANNCSASMTTFLLEQFGLEKCDLYRVHGPVNLVRLMQIPDWVDRPDLKFPPFIAGLPKGLGKIPNLFDTLRQGDVLLHHPYQSFAPVIELIQQAAKDPKVVAIKMTVYRTGTDSVLMESLIRAAQNGKEVTVVLELMARFEEEANIGWATRLEEVGAHVVYGVVGYKVHAKALLIVRREEGGLRRYAHLGTGNYHPRTTRLYTDFGLMTANEELTLDVSEVFKQLTGLGRALTLKHLLQAPFTLQPAIVNAIRNEAEIARSGRPARIIAKMNALLEPQTIETLYEASQAGVHIDLIVRGVCALKPGVPGLSENIRVRSLVGRFLEHHRIYYFHADGKELIYLSSADWMDRNFFRRIELAFPILDPKLKKRVLAEGLRSYLRDNQLSWLMDSQGKYHRKHSSRAKAFNAQSMLMQTLGNESPC